MPIGIQQICGYRRGDVPAGVPFIHEDSAVKLVLAGSIDLLLKYHRSGEMCVSPALDYSARRGKHQVTQALLQAGVTVTRGAIRAAAKLGGVGVDLLLAGLRGEDLEMARHDALQARLLVGEFRRAHELLELNVKPSAICYNALVLGAKLNHPESWRIEAQQMLDVMLPLTDIEQLTPEVLSVILRAGRPIHFERTLDIAQRTPQFLMVPALMCDAPEAINWIRGMGVELNEETFVSCVKELSNLRLGERLLADDRLLELYETGAGAILTGTAAGEFLTMRLKDWEYSLAQVKLPDERSYKIANSILLPLLKCTHTSEHLRLFDTIDAWRKEIAYPPISMHATTVMKHVIQQFNRDAAVQYESGSPQP